MPKINKNVRTVLVNYSCDECFGKPHAGCILIQTDKTFLTYPPKYEYECPVCKKLFILDTLYPVIEYEKEDENAW